MGMRIRLVRRYIYACVQILNPDWSVFFSRSWEAIARQRTCKNAQCSWPPFFSVPFSVPFSSSIFLWCRCCRAARRVIRPPTSLHLAWPFLPFTLVPATATASASLEWIPTSTLAYLLVSYKTCSQMRSRYSRIPTRQRRGKISS